MDTSHVTTLIFVLTVKTWLSFATVLGRRYLVILTLYTENYILQIFGIYDQNWSKLLLRKKGIQFTLYQCYRVTEHYSSIPPGNVYICVIVEMALNFVWHVSVEPCLFMRIVIWHYWQISDHIGSLLDWRKYHRTRLQILKITVAERSSSWIFPWAIN